MKALLIAVALVIAAAADASADELDYMTCLIGRATMVIYAAEKPTGYDEALDAANEVCARPASLTDDDRYYGIQDYVTNVAEDIAGALNLAADQTLQ